MTERGIGPVVGVCRIPEVVPSSIDSDLIARLSDAERDRLEGMSLAERRFQFVASRLLLRRMKEATGYSHVSISHCRGHVAVAMAGAQVGVDIENQGRYSWAVADRVLGREAADFLSRLTEAERGLVFTRMWVITEACGKAIGRGLQPPRIEIELPPGSEGVWGALRWEVLAAPDGTALAVAWAGPGGPVPAVALSWEDLVIGRATG